MNSKSVCPTVPPLYTWDSGTRDVERDNSWDKSGTRSLKSLAQAVLAVPAHRDNVGQGAGQSEKSCPTATSPPGTRFVPSDLTIKGTETTGHPAPTAYTPTSEQITHAERMLVDCPSTPGVKVHCWYCSRCDRVSQCRAWRHLSADVKWFKLSGPPYSLYVAETIQAEAEVLQ